MFRVERRLVPKGDPTETPAEAARALVRRVWDFIFLERCGEPVLTLDRYALERRESPRHGWRAEPQDVHRRIPERQGLKVGLQEHEVDIPSDVQAEALAKFQAAVRFGKWSAVR